MNSNVGFPRSNSSPASVWTALESVPGLAAVQSVWQHWSGGETELIQQAFLQASVTPASAVPCPRGCGCEHAVVLGAGGTLWGICQCEPWNCADLPLRQADVVVWELSWTKLTRAVCDAFALGSRFLDLGIRNTLQVGAWSADAVPVFLALHWDRASFRSAVAELVARARRPFILFAPTNSHMDAASQEHLDRIGAKCFALEQCALLAPSGRLASRVAPGELFTAFNPAVQAPDEDTATKVFGVVLQLDAGERLKPPTLLTVFRMYCIDQLPAAQIARRCNCAKSTVLARLNLIGQRTGCKPDQLRRMSPHLANAEASLSDSRARRIHRRTAIYGEEDLESLSD